MRREKQTEYIDWLKSLGCVMYLPLSYNDLEDKINNVSITQSTGSFSWNTSLSMYQFNTPNRENGAAALLNNGFSKNWFNTNTYSFLVHFKKVTASGGFRMFTNQYTNAGSKLDNFCDMTPLYNNSTNLANFPNDYFYCRTCNQNEWVKQYQQGEFYAEGDASGASTVNKPSEWNTSGTIYIFPYYFSRAASFCINEVYMFDNILELSQIRKIQGYE